MSNNGASAETSTMTPNPKPPETAGVPSDAQAAPERPKRRKRAARGGKAKSAETTSTAAPTEEQLADIGLLNVLAAKAGVPTADYVEDQRSMVAAWDAMQAYAEASRAK